MYVGRFRIMNLFDYMMITILTCFNHTCIIYHNILISKKPSLEEIESKKYEIYDFLFTITIRIKEYSNQ